MTPYTWRNFVNGAPTARVGQMELSFLQKRHLIYKLSVIKQKTGQKTGKNPPKKGVFISTSDHLSNFWRQQLLRPATFRASNFSRQQLLTPATFGTNNFRGQQLLRQKLPPFKDRLEMLLVRTLCLFLQDYSIPLLASKVAGLKSCWRQKLMSWSEVLIKTPFLEGFYPFFVLFFA